MERTLPNLDVETWEKYSHPYVSAFNGSIKPKNLSFKAAIEAVLLFVVLKDFTVYTLFYYNSEVGTLRNEFIYRDDSRSVESMVRNIYHFYPLIPRFDEDLDFLHSKGLRL